MTSRTHHRSPLPRWPVLSLAALFVCCSSPLAYGQQPAPDSGPQLPSAPSSIMPPMQVVRPGSAPDTGATGLTLIAAVQRALDANPALHIQQHMVDYYRAAVLVQSGPFDPTISIGQATGRNLTPLSKATIQQVAATGLNTRADAVISNMTSVGVSKLFRDGIQISPSLNLSETSDNLTNRIGNTTAAGSVTVTFPLLRNRGTAVVDAQERAAQREAEAQSLQLAQTTSITIAQTVSAYWNYVGALQSLDAYRQSEGRGQLLLQNTNAMIAADALARSETNFALANLATRTSNRAAAEQQVVQAAQALATAIGVAADAVLSIAAPGDPLPQLTEDADLAVTPVALLGYIQGSLQTRADYLAATRRVLEADTLRIGAKGGLLPQLNLNVTAGYSALQENGRFNKYFGAIYQNSVGPNISGGVTFNFPIGNHYFRGLYEEASASLNQAIENVVLVGNGIATGVVSAANGLNTSGLQLRAAHQATDSYRSALEGERERLRFGQSSLLNILQSEDRYISAQLNEIASQVAYANAIANFRYNTGTFINPLQPTQSVGPNTFYHAQTPVTVTAPGTNP